MITTDAKTRVPFTPDWHRDKAGELKEGAPVFHLRQGSVIERGQLQAVLSGPYRAGQIFGFELREAIRTGVVVLLEGDPDLDHVLELLEAEAEAEGVIDQLSAEDKRLLIDTKHVLSEHWPAYRDLLAQMERRKEIAPIVALQRFCTGWENVVDDNGKPIPFARGRDGVADAALGRLQQLELLVAGNRAYQLQFGNDGETAGNSERPGSSAQDPTTSPAEGTSTEAGTSPAKRGRKTPA
jgi:hypothetical protein